MDIKHHEPNFLGNGSLALDFGIFARELADAKYSLGLLEGSQKNLQNPSLLISPLTVKEATASSSIEGTQSTVSDVYLFEAGAKPKHSDTFQVINYRKAINHALNEMQKGRPLSLGLIKELHKILLNGVRHKGELGKFRNCLVWIAEKEGDPIEKALYIPPEHYRMQDYMDDLMNFITGSEKSAIVKAGIAHYQFEAIHPFEDGNGRVGRLLVPLILFHEKKLTAPILYLSGYFESHRTEYMRYLRDTDASGKYESWLAFFAKSIAEQLKETQTLVNDIYALHASVKTLITTKSPYIGDFVDFLFDSPIFTVPMMRRKLNIKTTLTAVKLIRLFKEKNLITESLIRHVRAKMYNFTPLLDLL